MHEFSILPKELFFLVLDNLEYPDKVELLSCCVEWYELWLKKHFRKISIRRWEKKSWIAIPKLIDNPYDQLELQLLDGIRIEGIIMSIRTSCQFSFQLSCQESELSEMIEKTDRLRVKRLHLVLDQSKSLIDLSDSFSKICECEALWLGCTNRNQEVSLSVPYISTVQSLSLDCVSGNLSIQNILSTYSKTLHHLSLYDCTISDVSMLGSIPHLEFFDCHNLVDISSLNNNDHIFISGCDDIRDYSNSFVNSRTIEISINSRRDQVYQFDLNKWTKVEDLKLGIGRNDTDYYVLQVKNHQLPATVRRCRLQGAFVAVIDFTVTANHKLQELILSNDETIQNLEAYGLERITIFECEFMNSLATLQGLGHGRNCKIVIRGCPLIRDFSPLSHVPIVSLYNCFGFNDFTSVRFVRDLSIRLNPSAKPHSPLSADNNPFANTHSLSISLINSIEWLKGVVKVPHLFLDYGDYFSIRHFLAKGNTFQNQRVVMKTTTTTSPEQILDLHEQYMKDHYDYYNKLPKRWIWVRKTDY